MPECENCGSANTELKSENCGHVIYICQDCGYKGLTSYLPPEPTNDVSPYLEEVL